MRVRSRSRGPGPAVPRTPTRSPLIPRTSARQRTPSRRPRATTRIRLRLPPRCSAIAWNGLSGPKEGDRVWQRHVLNCAVLAELVESGARVLDMGSGAGLPGIPLALARPDLEIVLLEPLARRVDWLRTVLGELELPVNVVRGRAEDAMVRKQWGGADVVTARAVAPLARLSGWGLPLLRPGGRLLAIKGASATDEVIRDREAVRGFGGSAPHVVQCGGTHVDPPTTVVVVERTATRGGTRDARRARGRQG